MSGIEDLQRNLGTLETTYRNIVDQSKQVGGFSDGPHVRAAITDGIEKFNTLSQNVRNSLVQLRKSGVEVSEYEDRFNDLNDNTRQNFPGIVQKLKSSPLQAVDEQMQDQEDSDLERIEEIQREVDIILQTMQEVKDIFQKTLAELQEQKYLLVDVEKQTSKAKTDVQNGNEELTVAEDHQKKCCCIVM